MSAAVRTAWLLAIAAWLIPIAVMQLVRLRRERELWAIALDVPFAVALDLLIILVLTRYVHLETAILVSRPAWIVVGAAMAVWRWRRHGWRPRWPSALGARDLLAAMTASALVVVVYSRISYRYLVWDWDLHFSNVTAMESQELPFINALSGTEIFHYHFSGDALAATLQTLSFDVISAMRALHTGHDLMLAAVAGSVTLLSIGLGLRRRWSAVLGGVSMVLQGPIPLRGQLGQAFTGYSYHGFPSVSYRPHMPIAALMLVGALGTVAVRAARPGLVSTRATASILAAVVSLLGVTDEASTGLLGLGLGVAWVVDPTLLARRRLTGLVLLVGLGVLFVDANLLLQASLAPGSPVQSVTLSADARVPSWSFDQPKLPLSQAHGVMVLFIDYLPLLACALALSLLALRLRSRPHVAVAALVWSLIVVSAVLLLRVEINKQGTESQRFLMAPFFGGVVLAALFLDRMPRGSFMASMALLGIAVPSAYSMYWIYEEGPRVLDGLKSQDPPTGSSIRLFDVDCRATVDAHFGDRPLVAYVESTEYPFVASCRPIFQLGEHYGWAIAQHSVTIPIPQLSNLDTFLVPRGQELDAICLRDREATSDAVCKRALRVRTSCRPEGSRYLRCPLTQADRDALLAH